jgi:Xaa-Pro aminopeptidase
VALASRYLAPVDTRPAVRPANPNPQLPMTRAQPSPPPYRFGPAPEASVELFAERRRHLLERIGGGVAVVPSAPELLKSRDTEVPYRPASDLYYLTGFQEPESVAVITPHGSEPFTLFVRERNPEREAWDGPRVGVDRAAALYGADAVHPIGELTARLPDLLKPAERVHLPLGAVEMLDRLVSDAVLLARRQRQRSGHGPAGLVDLEATTGEMRLLKDEAELERLGTAAKIAAEGHLAAMLAAREGAGEWEIQAALEGTFRAIGGSPPAFPSIVAAGANATVLHYVANRSRARDGDLVLIDAGAEWGMYCSDITRTFPASGRFTARQRALYDVVLAAEEAAIAAVRVGAPASAPHEAAVRILVQGMMDLEILPPGDVDGAVQEGRYRRFYMHQTSHWLGLDVHDVGPYSRGGDPVLFEPGMVLTIEPGIYIPLDADGVPADFRGVGIRIEDDVVVTPAGPNVITRGVPVDPQEIEAIVAG